jgi:tRNA (guanine10-N2)-dimethyltransferase
MQYFFILGKNPILSRAEIEAILNFRGFQFKIISFYEQILILEVKKEMDFNWLNNRLGGTVKIGRILDQINKLADFEYKFFKLIKFGQAKAYFGFSLYALAPEIKVQKYQRQLTPLAMEIKRKVREKYSLNSRYVVSREIALSSVIVKKNNLLKNGAEICFFMAADKILIGQTLAVQPFEEFGARDYGRPGRDDLAGMLPPKLARIMINLAQLPENQIILDPFCGSGTILQEALLLGYKNLIGMDISKKAVGDTQQNLQWLSSKYNLPVKQIKVSQQDVRQLAQAIKAASIEAIITEPFLGPALKGDETLEQLNRIIKELAELYLAAFKEFNKVLTKEGLVVIVLPIFKLKNFDQQLAILPAINKMGFKLLSQPNLIYGRPKQFIWRQIAIFKK